MCANRVRGPNLSVFRKFSDRVTMEEALRIVDGGQAGDPYRLEHSFVIPSNKRLSQAVGSDNWKAIQGAFPCWTGTMTAYDKPNKKLEKTIEYSSRGIRYIFPVPEEHVGKKNILLVAEHPDYMLEADGKTRILRASKVGIVAQFPTSSENWHLGDPEYDIPSGKKADGGTRDARYLCRMEKRVGLFGRGYCYYAYGGRWWFIGLDEGPPACGVAVEAL